MANNLEFLHPDHLADLRKSKLLDEIILEAGIISVRPHDIDREIGFTTHATSAYKIPYRGNGYARYKMFYAKEDRINLKDGEERPKYLVQKNSGNRLYIPKKIEPALRNVPTPLYLTEGEKKALKAVQEGIPCIAISGLWNWSDGTGALNDDFDEIDLRGRTVYIIPDNDFRKKNKKGKPKNLCQAVFDLGYLLLERGAKVFWVELPQDDTEKIGLDDYLCEHTQDEFLQLQKHEIQGLLQAIEGVTSETPHEDLKECIKRISRIKSAAEQDRFIEKLHEKSGIGKRVILKDLNAYKQSKSDKEKVFGNDVETYFLNENGFLCRYKQTRDGYLAKQKLCNFDARITEEITEDNGVDVAHTYGIEGCAGEKFMPKIEVPACQFLSLNWLHKWGNQVIVEPGHAVKDYVRHAIQVRSQNVKKLRYYTHTGWRKIDGRWAYLSGNGALGNDGVSVRLPRELHRYSLPLKPENEIESILASISFLSIGKREITLPLYAYVFLSPLTTILNPMPNFSAYLHAGTGNLKSTLAILLSSHYGDFQSVDGLSNFTDTVNSLEKRAFLLKDTLMVLDDFHPDNRRFEAQQKECLAQRIIRAYSNRTGRGRLNSDSSDKGRYEPRGMLLITGEELVSLQSTLARLMVIEYTRQDIDLSKLTELQKKRLCLGMRWHLLSSG